MKEEDLPSFGDKGGAEGKRNLKTGKGSEKKKKKTNSNGVQKKARNYQGFNIQGGDSP